MPRNVRLVFWFSFSLGFALFCTKKKERETLKSYKRSKISLKDEEKKKRKGFRPLSKQEKELSHQP